MGPQVTGLRGRQRRFFRAAQSSDRVTSHRAAQRHSAKTRHSTTPWHATQTQTTLTQSQTTPALPRGPVQLPKNRNRAPGLIFFERPASGRKHSLQNEGAHFENKLHFCTGKQHAFLSFHCVNYIFSKFRTFMFFDPKKAAQTDKKGPTWRAQVSDFSPKNCQTAHSDPKKWASKGPIPSFGGGPEGQSLRATSEV